MTVKEKRNVTISLGINIAIIILETIGWVVSWIMIKWTSFTFYTQDSNLLSLIISTIMLVYQIKSLKANQYIMPLWVKSVRYMATCCLTITFLVVVFVLAPMLGGMQGLFFLLFGANGFEHHLVCPILSMISFICLEDNHELTKKSVWIALIPTAIYAVITITLNILRVMNGPYPFLMVYNQPVYMSIIWFFVILGMALLISWALGTLAMRKYKKAKVSE